MQIDRQIDIVCNMLRDGQTPDTWTLNALLLAYANVADAAGALGIYT